MGTDAPKAPGLTARLRALLPVVAIVACVGLGAAVIVGSSLDAATYYRTVGEVTSAGAAHVGRASGWPGAWPRDRCCGSPGPAPRSGSAWRTATA